MSDASPFDDKAAQWDNRPLIRELVGATSKVLIDRFLSSPDASHYQVLDLGCGTGFLADQIRHKVKFVTGIDTSKGMIEAFQQKIAANPTVNMAPLLGDILAQPDLLQGRHFDLIISQMTLHHIEDISKTLKTLGKHLKPNGRIVVFDFLKEPHSHRFHGPGHVGVFHQGGFTLDEATEYLQGSGYINASAEVVYTFQKSVGDAPETLLDFKLFMAEASNTPYYVHVTEDVLDLNQLSELVTDPGAGAIASFVGITRNTFDNKRVTKLEYEAYIPMAEKKMTEMCITAKSKWDIISMAIVHRLGVVLVSEASVIITVSSAHRREALEACHWAIDELKATVPIWKKEFFEGGEVWKENAESRAHQQQLLHLAKLSS